MSEEIYWNLLNKELLLEFVEWLRVESPVTFRHLINQFLEKKKTDSDTDKEEVFNTPPKAIIPMKISFIPPDEQKEEDEEP